jgi:H2-forming N5,N10-methylenetetrahydromethanopterin dehydrogenase-like enzyme
MTYLDFPTTEQIRAAVDDARNDLIESALDFIFCERYTPFGDTVFTIIIPVTSELDDTAVLCPIKFALCLRG